MRLYAQAGTLTAAIESMKGPAHVKMRALAEHTVLRSSLTTHCAAQEH